MIDVAIYSLTPVERLYRLPVTFPTPPNHRKDSISLRLLDVFEVKHGLRVMKDEKAFESLTSVRGPQRLRRVLGLSRHEMAALLFDCLGRIPGRQTIYGWELREMTGKIEGHMIGRKAREAYWSLIESFTCEHGWRAVVDRRCRVHWRVTLKEMG